MLKPISFNCKIAPLGLLAAFLAGCATLSYYDATSYRNLTELKPVVAELYTTFQEPVLDDREVKSVRVRLDQLYEYEKGKGPDNKESVGQIEAIRGMFRDHLQNRKKQGPWNDTQRSNASENIMSAFDEAIQTEALKNKNE